MKNFFTDLQQLADVTASVTIIEAFLSIVLSFVLAAVIAIVYQHTHTGSNHSQSFVQTLVIMSIVVSVVMIVIGNNIAVAFGLVGAFSIIRFRTAMNDPKDIAFIFFGMAAGITSGLGFYMIAILFTLSVIAIILLMHYVDFGKPPSNNKLLKITVPENLHNEQIFDSILHRHLAYFALRQIETTNQGTMIRLEYLIQTHQSVTDKELIDELRNVNGNLKVSISYLNQTFFD